MMGIGIPRKGIGLLDIARASSNLLRVMNREEINNSQDLLRMSGDLVLVDNGFNPDYDGHVEFDIDYSIKGVSSLVMEYRLNPFGGLIQFRLDQHTRKTKSLIRCNESIDGYSPKFFDSFGNFGQLKIIPSADFNDVRDEVERLSRL